MDNASRYARAALLRKKSHIYREDSKLVDDGYINISTIRFGQAAEYLSKTSQSIDISNDTQQEFLPVTAPEKRHCRKD